MNWKEGFMEPSILSRCGISTAQKEKPLQWMKAKAVFRGSEHYVLGVKDCEVALRSRDGGFALTVRKPLVVKARSLLGRAGSGWLTEIDIEFDNGFPTLSLSTLSGVANLTLPVQMTPDDELRVLG